jgi:large subunit ribosomal protein L20
MNRITAGSHSTIKRKKILKLAKGFRGLSSKSYIFAKEQLRQALFDSYKGRKLKKRMFSRFWNHNISAYIKSKGFSYSFFIGALRKINIFLNKKILSTLIIFDKTIINFLIFLIKNKF